MARQETSLVEEGPTAAGKTLTAPLDRVKLLLQTRGGLQGGAIKAAARGGGVWDALVVIGREEGLLGYWKGNVPQVRMSSPHHRPFQLCSTLNIAWHLSF